MRINIRDKIIFSEKLLWIERDPDTKVVTFVFDGGIKLPADKVDFDKIKEVLKDSKDGKPGNVDQRSLFEMIFGKDH